MPTRIRSFSKINLGLAVGPVLPGTPFHALTTGYQTLEAHDLLTVTATPFPETRITLTADHPGVPRTETGDADKNTAVRIVRAALDLLELTCKVHINLEKRLPVQGGLGAGSANAAAALLALERELTRAFGIPPLAQADRLALAAETGSDVPLFLLGGTVLGTHRGETVSPLADLPATHCVLALPSVGVSTAQAFRDLDAQMAAAEPASLPNSPTVDKLEQLSHALTTVLGTAGREASESGPSGIAPQTGDLAEKLGFPSPEGDPNPLLALVRTGIANDFEEVVFAQHPSLRSTKRELVGTGSVQALYAALSGSGSALFGLYGDEGAALAAQQRVQASGTRAVVTKTLPRAAYWHTMFAE